MAAALDHPVSPSSTETAGVEPVAVDVTPRTADPQDPLERSAAQLDLGMRAATDMLVESAKAWSALSRTYTDILETNRRAYGELLITWHQRLRHPTER